MSDAEYYGEPVDESWLAANAKAEATGAMTVAELAAIRKVVVPPYVGNTRGIARLLVTVSVRDAVIVGLTATLDARDQEISRLKEKLSNCVGTVTHSVRPGFSVKEEDYDERLKDEQEPKTT